MLKERVCAQLADDSLGSASVHPFVRRACVCRDLTNGQCRVTCSHDDAVTHIEWAPNGEPFIFSSSVDKSIKSVDTTAITRTHELEPRSPCTSTRPSHLRVSACGSLVGPLLLLLLFLRLISPLCPCVCVCSSLHWGAAAQTVGRSFWRVSAHVEGPLGLSVGLPRERRRRHHRQRIGRSHGTRVQEIDRQSGGERDKLTQTVCSIVRQPCAFVKSLNRILHTHVSDFSFTQLFSRRI